MTSSEAWNEWYDSFPPQANYIEDPGAERRAFEAGFEAGLASALDGVRRHVGTASPLPDN